MSDGPRTRSQDAALADAANLGPAPTITSTGGTDSGGNAYVEVTASYPFETVSNDPGNSQHGFAEPDDPDGDFAALS